MAENARPPVAIRIVRPFDTEDELLDSELETIGKTSVVLIGAHPRPTGVILRFEITLQDGASVLRGEGRVLAHKENAFRGQAGLTLRFTRLDPKSKGVVDRATAMRESRAALAAPASPIAQALSVETPAPMPVTASPKPPAAVDQELAVQAAREAAREKANAQARMNAKRTSRTPPPLPSGAPRVSLTPPPAPADSEDSMPVPSSAIMEVAIAVAPPPESLPILIAPDSESQFAVVGGAEEAVTSIPGEVAEIEVRGSSPGIEVRGTPAPPRPVTESTTAPPRDRADLLARLRSRAAELPPERVQAILDSAPRRQAR